MAVRSLVRSQGQVTAVSFQGLPGPTRPANIRKEKSVILTDFTHGEKVDTVSTFSALPDPFHL